MAGGIGSTRTLDSSQKQRRDSLLFAGAGLIVAANHLKSLREARGLSLVGLATKVGTTGQQISHLELGKRHLTVEWLEKLAAALECHPWDIVDERPATDEREEQLVALFKGMVPEDQDALLTTAAKLAQSRLPTKARSR